MFLGTPKRYVASQAHQHLRYAASHPRRPKRDISGSSYALRVNWSIVGNKKNGGMFESPTSSTGKVPPTTPRSYQKFRAPPSVVRGTPWPENSPAQEGDETETDGDSGEVVSALSQNASRLAAAREHNASLLVAATEDRSDVERLAAAREHNARLPQQPQTQEEAWQALARDVHLAQKRAGPTGPRTAEEVADLKERKRLWLEDKAPKRSSSGSSTGVFFNLDFI